MFIRAEKCILKEIEILNEVQFNPSVSKAYLFLGEISLNADRKEKAVENLKKAEGMFQEMGMNYWLNRTEEVLEKQYMPVGSNLGN